MDHKLKIAISLSASISIRSVIAIKMKITNSADVSNIVSNIVTAEVSKKHHQNYYRENTDENKLSSIWRKNQHNSDEGRQINNKYPLDGIVTLRWWHWVVVTIAKVKFWHDSGSCALCLLSVFALLLRAMFLSFSQSQVLIFKSNTGPCSLKPCFPCFHFYSRICFSLSLSIENVFLGWRTEEKHSINVLLSRIMSIKWSWLMLGVFWVFIIWLPPPLSSFRCHHFKHHTHHTNIHDRHHRLHASHHHHPAPHNMTTRSLLTCRLHGPDPPSHPGQGSARKLNIIFKLTLSSSFFVMSSLYDIVFIVL